MVAPLWSMFYTINGISLIWILPGLIWFEFRIGVGGGGAVSLGVEREWHDISMHMQPFTAYTYI